MIPFIKKTIKSIPYPLGYLLALIPYRYRPIFGAKYRQHYRHICDYESWDTTQRKTYVFENMVKIVKHAYRTVPFYHMFYTRHGFSPLDLKRFDDITQIPMITKTDLMETPLVERSVKIAGRYLTNTGGSSGMTLNFFITPELIPNEWAHMHWIWNKLGFHESDLKLVLAGGHTKGHAVIYDGLRHQYAANVYCDWKLVGSAVKKIMNRHAIVYLKGYPSALYEFTRYCKMHDPEIIPRMRTNLKGVLLGSEYPVPQWRKLIESVFEAPSISWYGHTERAILAWEKESPYVYHPFQTYGYCEVAPDSRNSESGRLIGTSYLNRASPLIRYDTGDDVNIVKSDDGLLQSFSIRNGRIGDFVEDRQQHRIPLTALIYGRHHALFNIARFIQVYQQAPGKMMVLVTLPDGMETPRSWNKWFDTYGVDMDIEYKRIRKPIRSPMGKVTLKVSTLQNIEMQE